jgi:hypothetical protein
MARRAGSRTWYLAMASEGLSAIRVDGSEAWSRSELQPTSGTDCMVYMVVGESLGYGVTQSLLGVPETVSASWVRTQRVSDV